MNINIVSVSTYKSTILIITGVYKWNELICEQVLKNEVPVEVTIPVYILLAGITAYPPNHVTMLFLMAFGVFCTTERQTTGSEISPR